MGILGREYHEAARRSGRTPGDDSRLDPARRTLGHPGILVIGDLILDRYIWGDAQRISQEAPFPCCVPIIGSIGSAAPASVGLMLRTLDAEVSLIGTVGRDPESVIVRKLLADLGIDDQLVVPLDDRPTTLKERYIGRCRTGIRNR